MPSERVNNIVDLLWREHHDQATELILSLEPVHSPVFVDSICGYLSINVDGIGFVRAELHLWAAMLTYHRQLVAGCDGFTVGLYDRLLAALAGVAREYAYSVDLFDDPMDDQHGHLCRQRQECWEMAGRLAPYLPSGPARWWVSGLSSHPKLLGGRMVTHRDNLEIAVGLLLLEREPYWLRPCALDTPLMALMAVS